MRGVIRKMMNIDSIFWIIALGAIALTLYGMFGLPNVDAVTQAEFNEIKAQELAANNELVLLKQQREDQQKLINTQGGIISDLQEGLIPFEGKSDWESLRLKGIVIEAVQNAVTVYDILRDELKAILTLQSDQVKIIKSLGLATLTLDNSNTFSHLETRIGVSLSKTCETMIRNNFTTTCPTYKQLIQLDNSEAISGKFITDSDGFFHRGDEAVQNSYRFYWNDSQIRIIVDPPGSMMDRMKMIYIQPNFDTYIVREDKTIDDKFEIIQGNRTLTSGDKTKLVNFDVRNQTDTFATVIYHDRYINKCHEAKINADNWLFLLPDTIHLMRNGCDRDYTAFEEREIITPNSTAYSPADSPEWNILQEAKRISEFCIFKYKACT
jgi:hypothetical protein